MRRGKIKRGGPKKMGVFWGFCTEREEREKH